MKRIFLLMAICLFPLIAYSQFGFIPKGYETLDNTALRVFYEFNYPPTFKTVKRPAIVSVEDSLKQERSMDYMLLEIGKTGISKFYSDYKRQVDSMIVDLMQNPKQKAPMMMENLKNSGIQRADEREIFKNYPEGKMTVTDQVGLNAFRYEENLNEIEWQITSDTMTCLNYLCQKATADFRGRRYEAWFAPDLPVSDGPWKFSGLPGLILLVKDSDNKYIIKAVALDNTQTPLNFTKRDYIKTTRQEIEKMKKRFAEDPVGYMVNTLAPGADAGKIPDQIPDGQGGTISRADLKMTYNPMELE